MVRLATCFSGIGAIEHALNRMGVDNEIVFACDNGDVDILTKDIALDIAEIEAEFKDLKRIINEIEEDDYKNELKRDLERDSELFDEQKAKLKKVDSQVKDALLKIFEYVTSSDGVNSKRKKEYASFSKSLSTKKGVNESLYILSYAVEVTNDFHKDNSWESIKHNDITYSSKDGIDWNTVRATSPVPGGISTNR